MKRDNKMGPRVLGEISIPQKMTADQFVTVINSDEFAVVIDTRGRYRIAATNYLKGASFAPLTKAFNTTVGSLDGDEYIYLVVEEERNYMKQYLIYFALA